LGGKVSDHPNVFQGLSVSAPLFQQLCPPLDLEWGVLAEVRTKVDRFRSKRLRKRDLVEF
jgi:hypothetical protein